MTHLRGLTLRALTVSLAGRRIVDLDLTVPPGSVQCLVGPSGMGKSTALGAIAGTLPRDFTLAGEILLNGVAVGALPAWQRRIGLLFQDALLFPHLSVAGNLALGLARGGQLDRKAAIATVLARIGLEGMGARDPATLSGGQQARVALMRTLLSAPGALLLDEPFARLDRPLRQEMRGLVLELAAEAQVPVILVTHDPEDVLASGLPACTPLGDKTGTP